MAMEQYNYDEQAAKTWQLDLMRENLAYHNYPGYPSFNQRLVYNIEDFDRTLDGALIIPEGPWEIRNHPNQLGPCVNPDIAEQQALRLNGYILLADGRPLHPWFQDMIEDPSMGVVTGKGFYRNWGPNYTVDSVIFKDDQVLLIQRKDTGMWALPGGFIDAGESSKDAAVREVQEETGLEIEQTCDTYTAYKGAVADLRITANAWAETEVFVFNLGRNSYAPKAGDDAAHAQWIPIDVAMNAHGLFGSHRYFLEEAVRQGC